jgi:choline dehydrogenase-like flavoprotein
MRRPPAFAFSLLLALPAPSVAEPASPSFDYVIVGAGAAGSVVASRLSEDPAARVLLLEAGGPDEDPRIARPSAYRELAGGELDWKLQTEEEPGLGGRRVPWPRGRVWGGSGTISAMIYVRGPAADYDRWRELGNPGWGFADVLPYFRKAENQERGPSERHGTGGPQNVADPRFVPPLSRAFLEAARAAGLPANDDFNGPSPEGVGLYQLNQKNGERHAAPGAYLRPATTRPNLTVESHALVTRVLVESGRAVGVAYREAGVEREARAAREVVLCAGAVGSPQLLMLSGIGPAAHLREAGVPVVHDLPGVGSNLQDHPRVALTWESAKPLGLTAEERAQADRDWARARTGPHTNPGVGAGAFVRTGDGPLPDVQITPTANPAAGTFSLHVACLRPASRGTVRLRSSDPVAPPLIRARYLAEEADLETLLRGLAVARRIAGAAPLAGYRGRELSAAVAEGGEPAHRYVRENATTFFHPVGTCRMGQDPLAVVDPQLRVRGIAGLRVIDASVMPALVGGATHAAAVMIAEKGADLIKETW